MLRLLCCFLFFEMEQYDCRKTNEKKKNQKYGYLSKKKSVTALLQYRIFTHTCNKPYLDWMVMKVRYHNFIFVIYGHKVRTWKWQRRQRQKEREDDSSGALEQTRGSSTLFMEFEKTRRDTVVTKRLWVLMWDSTWDTGHTTERMQLYIKREHTFTGN